MLLKIGKLCIWCPYSRLFLAQAVLSFALCYVANIDSDWKCVSTYLMFLIPVSETNNCNE